MNQLSPQRPLTRSRSDVMIAGVCGGLAEWLGWDPTLVRVLYTLVRGRMPWGICQPPTGSCQRGASF